MDEGREANGLDQAQHGEPYIELHVGVLTAQETSHGDQQKDQCLHSVYDWKQDFQVKLVSECTVCKLGQPIDHEVSKIDVGEDGFRRVILRLIVLNDGFGLGPELAIQVHTSIAHIA